MSPVPLHERARLYAALETRRERPLIAYVTSSRPGITANIAADVVPEIVAQLQALPAAADRLDLLICSNGGDPTVACRIVTLIRERVKHFSVLVPSAAFSAATLIALGADEILMHPYGNLGPVDPQVQIQRQGPNGQPVQMRFGSEDLAAFLNFARNKVGLTDQAQLSQTFEKFCAEVGAVPIGVAARSAQLSLSMGQKLLQLHMRGSSQEQRARVISKKLSEDFYHHGYALGRTEAKGVGLKIARPDRAVEDLVWQIWQNIEADLELRRAFSPLELVQKNPDAAGLFRPVQLPMLPAGMAGPGMQTIIQVPPTPYELSHAIVESCRCASSFKNRGLIFATRTPDLQMPINVVSTSMGWESQVVPEFRVEKPGKVPKPRKGATDAVQEAKAT